MTALSHPTHRVDLHIGEHETELTIEDGHGARSTQRLPIGTLRPGGPAFVQNPPRAVALEVAIAGVEDVVMPLARQVPAGSRLTTADPLATAIGPGPVLPLDEIEARFAQLADAAEGSVTAAAGLPSVAGYAGYLLILRELMHHLGLSALHLESAGPHPAAAAGAHG